MSWVQKTFWLLCFIAVFFKYFLKANLSLAYMVLFIKRSQIRSEIVIYNTRDLSRFEVLVLAQVITLTPGTITAFVDENYDEIKIHVFTTYELSNKSNSPVEQSLKTALLRLTR